MFLAPQIVGAVNDGDTLVGNGLITTILTNCSCTNGKTAADLAPFMSDFSSASAASLLTKFNTLNNADGMATYIEPRSENVYATSILSGSNVCGGIDQSFLTICNTNFYNHSYATILATFMTDGTPASIATKSADIRKVGDRAADTWLAQALLNIHEGQYSATRLPGNVPGALTPLLWWTTPNLLSTDPALLEAGIETYFTILLRAAMQRTYSVKGNTCIRNVFVEGSAIMYMNSYGVIVSLVILSIQLIASVLAAAAFIPWFLQETPIGPGVRLIKENIYFMTVVNSSGYIQGFQELCNAPTHTIWQILDQVVRIGESLSTRADVVGHIILVSAYFTF
jgi:hypothetical protein